MKAFRDWELGATIFRGILGARASRLVGRIYKHISAGEQWFRALNLLPQ